VLLAGAARVCEESVRPTALLARSGQILRSIGETDRVVGRSGPSCESSVRPTVLLARSGPCLQIIGKTDRVVDPVRPEFVNRRPDVASWIVFRTPLV
jgi:hypothetical protein